MKIIIATQSMQIPTTKATTQINIMLFKPSISFFLSVEDVSEEPVPSSIREYNAQNKMVNHLKSFTNWR